MHSTIENWLTTGDRARITVVRDQAKHLACRIMDASETMFCVATPEPLVPGEKVRLSSINLRGDGRLIAEVRHSMASKSHYFAGLEAVDDRTGSLDSIALRELFDRVPGNRPQPRHTVAARTTLGVAAASVVAAVVVILAGLSAMIDRASAGEPTVVQAAVRDADPGVPEPPPLSSRLSIRATGLSWVTACADGTKLFERLFQAGDAADISFFETAILRSGNAGGLQLMLGDTPIESMGPWGAIRMIQATPQAYNFVPPVLNGACSAN